MRHLLTAAAIAIASLCAEGRALSQSTDSLVMRAFELEGAGKPRDAAPLFRRALRGADAANALLGLERVYAELGWQDSLLAPVDSLLTVRPRDAIVNTVKLRTLNGLGREQLVSAAFDAWVRAVPGDPSPYREYARLLLERGRTAGADSVVRRAQLALGSTKDLQLEVAQLRAALGMWVLSAEAWRGALATASYLDQAAVYALRPTPMPVRDSVRRVLLAAPPDPGARLALAGLEAVWGNALDGWTALRDLPPDSGSAAAWREFGERAERDQRWPLARDAYGAALRWRRTPDLALRAATAALESGDASAALSLAPLTDAGSDSTLLVDQYVPLHVRALALLGRAAGAERLVQSVDRQLTPGSRARLTRQLAFAWVRTGDLGRARASLAEAGAESDSSETAGWIALYEGDLKTARVVLRRGGESTPELALALALIARLKSDTAVEIGRAFLTLARGDTAAAAQRFEAAAVNVPAVASLLLSTSAQLRAQHRDLVAAERLWRSVAERHADSPEAPAAAIEWARALRRRGDVKSATAALEQLILTHPESSLLPQARRELELMRQSIPGSGP